MVQFLSVFIFVSLTHFLANVHSRHLQCCVQQTFISKKLFCILASCVSCLLILQFQNYHMSLKVFCIRIFHNNAKHFCLLQFVSRFNYVHSPCVRPSMLIQPIRSYCMELFDWWGIVPRVLEMANTSIVSGGGGQYDLIKCAYFYFCSIKHRFAWNSYFLCMVNIVGWIYCNFAIS